MSRYLKTIAICAALVIGPDNLYAKGTWDGEWIGKLEGCGYDQVVRGVVEGSHFKLKLQFTYEENLKLKLSPSGEIKEQRSIARESEPHITRNYRSFFSGKFSRDYYDGYIYMTYYEDEVTTYNHQVECNLGFVREGTLEAGLIKAGKPLSVVSDPNMRELERLRRENARLNERKEKQGQSESKNSAQKENEKLRQKIARLEKEKQQSKPKVVAKRQPKPQKSLPASTTTGSGFFVSRLGHILTNEHVVRQCRSVSVGDNANKQVTASIIDKDKRNDLALLRISSTETASAETQSLISKLSAKKLGIRIVPLASGGLMRSDDIELGESVLVAGFPYGELYSNTIKVTGGMVSAVRGMGDDSAQFQMDAAVQPGNSGGPIYDENGNIVGVVVAQLDPLKVAKTIGSLPQNVNFGIKASTVRQFLTAAGLPTKWSDRKKKKSRKEVAQIAKKQTVMVMCHQ